MITVDLGSVFLGGCVIFAAIKISRSLTHSTYDDTISAEQYQAPAYTDELPGEGPEIQQAYVPGYNDEQPEIADVVSVSGRAAEDNLLGEAL